MIPSFTFLYILFQLFILSLQFFRVFFPCATPISSLPCSCALDSIVSRNSGGNGIINGLVGNSHCNQWQLVIQKSFIVRNTRI